MFIIQKDGAQVLPTAFATMEAVQTHLEGLQACCVFLSDLYGYEPSGSVVARWEGPDGSRYDVRRLCFRSDTEGEPEVETILSILAAARDLERVHCVRAFTESLLRKK